MSYPVKVSVEVKGGPELNEFSSLSLSQFLFTHHTFALDFSFEALGRALNMKPDMVYMRAHEQLIGKDLTISWQAKYDDGPKGTFKFRGVILETSVHTSSDLTSYYHISGHSPTFLLEDGLQQRAFRQQSAQAIFQQVLAPYPEDLFEKKLQAQHREPLPYLVQYQESNFQFLTRLAAQQGEWLYYDGLTLHLGASPQGSPVRFEADSNQSFALAMRLQPTRLQGAHYNYRTHAPSQATAAPPSGGHPYAQFAGQRSEALFTQPHRLRGDSHARDEVQLQRALDQSAARSAGALVTLEGQGDRLFTLRPGTLLDVYDASQAGYGKFRVLAVHHRITDGSNYSQHFEAQPGAEALPPPHPLAAPPTAEAELAEVIDLTDPRGLGRVRVRFQWDVAQPQDAESGWLRVSTPYSGDGKGQLFTPEKGSQVLIGYEHGLAEQPVVLGNLFHARNQQGAKYSPPQNNLKGIQTAGGNKVVMSEVAGAQTILLSNSNKKGTSILVSFADNGSVAITTNGPIKLTSGDSISIEAKKSISLRAGGDITLAADKNILVETKEENIGLRAKKELLLTATDADLTLEAGSKKVVVKAAKDVEIAASGTAKIMGSDIKWSKS